jgi:hypothetical protein
LGQPKLRDGWPDDVLLQRENSGTVCIAVGNKDGTAMRLADDGDELRALAIDSLVGTTSG